MGAGKRDADEIKEHPFFSNLNWQDAIQRKLKVPKPYVKKVIKQEYSSEKGYGKGAFDDTLKNHNRLNEWSFIGGNAP
mgnify:CR=1 FL=1